MRTTATLGILVIALSGWAGTNWQFVPGFRDGLAFIKGGQSLYLVNEDATILRTENGRDWVPAGSLANEGETARITHLERTDNGLHAWVRVTGTQANTVVYQLFRTSDGVEWESGFSVEWATEDSSMALSEPYAVSGGWIIHTERAAPAVVWHSTDGFEWQEVYREEDDWFLGGEYRTGSLPALKFSGSGQWDWIQSADGVEWTERAAGPQQIFTFDGYRVGVAGHPGVPGTVFYAEGDGPWQMVYDPGGSMAGQSAVAAGNTILLIRNYVNISYSTNGRDWMEAEVTDEAVLPSGLPAVKTMIHHDGRFWYRLTPRPSPVYEGPPLESVTLVSDDGSSWSLGTFPAAYEDDLIWPDANPEFSYPPGPGYNPSTDRMLPEKQVELPGYSLLMTWVPEYRRMGTFMSVNDGEFEPVNTSWGAVNASYPFAGPVDIASFNGRFVVLNEYGRVGVYEPGVENLPQPVGLQASQGTYDDHVELRWEPVDGAAEYRIYRSPVDNPDDQAIIATVAESGYMDAAIPDIHASYRYWFQAVSPTAESWLSESVSGRLYSVLVDGVIPEPGEYWRPDFIIVDFGGYPLLKANVDHYPWIYTSTQGWQYCLEKPGNLWLWDTALGWTWTRYSLFPVVYVAAEKEWLYYVAGGNGVRWYYAYSNGEYRMVAR